MEISNGIHLHTIEASDETIMDRILNTIERYRLRR
ncbi:MAG TPA: 3H domain-containing protein [Fervidobacterium sp.]|nr:3H domain-containing protein [Fervidobacterium sp.]